MGASCSKLSDLDDVVLPEVSNAMRNRRRTGSGYGTASWVHLYSECHTRLSRGGA